MSQHETVSLTRGQVIAQLPLDPEDFIVEIGAGPIPYEHTKLIIEKYPFESHQRWGDTKNIAPIIKADAHKLPLSDKSCDCLFLSHVIEHLDRPELFLQEARRCSHWLYIEFPKRPLELMYAWPFHRWLIETEGQKLTFYRNDIPQIFGGFFHLHYDFLLDMWEERRFEQLNHHIFIETDGLTFEHAACGAFEHICQTSAHSRERINYNGPYAQEGTGSLRYTKRQLIKIITWALVPDRLIRARRRAHDWRNKGRLREITPAIVSKLACQTCRQSALGFNDGDDSKLICASCGAVYKKEQGVFDFDV